MWRLKYKWIYDYLEEHSGKTFESPKDLIHLHDTLKIQKQSGKALVPTEIKPIQIYQFIFKLFAGFRIGRTVFIMKSKCYQTSKIDALLELVKCLDWNLVIWFVKYLNAFGIELVDH